MSIQQMLLGGSPSGYNLTRSLRFRASASAYLNRTTGTATNQVKWTWSGWVKRGTLGTVQVLANGYQDNNNLGNIAFVDDCLQLGRLVGGSVLILRKTNAVFRDPSSWYHVVFVFDNANGTVADRVQIYVNGVLQTYSTSNDPGSTGFFINANSMAQRIGRSGSTSSPFYFDGYLAEVNFIDGQALTPSSFGSTNALTGVWQPAPYTGTYGTNGFYLPFTDNSALTTSSNVGLGQDFSGNANYWETNNISITAGLNYDSMTDVPTLTNATTANFCVLNPLDKNSSMTSEYVNLVTIKSGSGYGVSRATFGVTSGKYYWEGTVVGVTDPSGSTGRANIGIQTQQASLNNYIGADAYGWMYNFDGLKINNATSASYGATYITNDVIGVALDMTAGTLTFYKNGVSQGQAYSGLTGTILPAFSADSADNSSGWVANFGQRPFAYTPPTGFVALNTFNLPTATIVKSNTVMDATLYTGTGAAQTIANAAAFYPDYVWAKQRSGANNNIWVDSNRGATNFLVSNTNGAEATNSAVVSAIGSTGFTLGTDGTINGSGQTNVAWQWNAGSGSTSSNTDGAITSTVSVNASAGFSIAKFTTQASGVSTFGHGLGVDPAFYMVTSRSATSGRNTYHKSIGATQYLQMNTTAAAATDSSLWNNTAPTSTLITIGTAFAGGSTAICYAWSEIDGFSKFGSYIGNGSADGPFVYLGFRPKFVMIKRTNNISNWTMRDTSRSPINVTTADLYANLSNAETAAGPSIDLLSNGFKLREAGGQATNENSNTYIYACFSENPFKNSLAR